MSPASPRDVAVTAAPYDSYDAAVARGLPTLGTVLAALFAAVSVLHLVMLEGGIRVTMSTTAAVSAVVFAGAAAAAWRRRVPDQLAQPVMAGLLVVAGVNAVLHLALSGEPHQTTNVMLLLVGAGAVLLSRRWLAAALYVVWAAWAVAALLIGPSPRWPHYVIGMVLATLLSLVVNHLRRTNVSELAQARTAAEASAVRDHLTGLANRRGLAMLGGQILEQARRQGDAANAIFLDIDGMKKINDTLGHAVGDDVIVAVAESLRSATRATDVVARWGGDEFCVVGPGAGMAPIELERRVREGVLLAAVVPEGVWDVRVSAGGAMLAPWDSGSLETLLGKADQEMYLRRSLRKENPLPRRRPATAESPPTTDA